MAPKIARAESVEFSYRLDNLGTDQHGSNLMDDWGKPVSLIHRWW